MNAKIYKVGATLDATSAKVEQEGILAILDEGTSVVIDLSETTYVSSAGLRVLLYSYKVGKIHGKDVCLVGICKEVKDVMKMTGFEHFFKIYDTLEECEKEMV